jgi:hypothetical protein
VTSGEGGLYWAANSTKTDGRHQTHLFRNTLQRQGASGTKGMDNRSIIEGNSSSGRPSLLVVSFAGARGAVASWLLHCADPLGSNLSPPHPQLSARRVRKLLLKADAHKVLPSVLRHYPFSPGDATLEQVRQEADALRLERAALSTMLRYHANVIIEAAGELPLALVKGPTFAALYPPGMRPFGDIDLLVSPAALPQLAVILTELGFIRLEESRPNRLEDAWVHRDNSVLMMEVHTNLVHEHRMRAAFSMIYSDLAGNFHRPGALLAIAVVHGAMHYFAWLRHVVDICQAARAVVTPDEESLFELLANRTGTRMAAIIGLSLAYRLFSEGRCLEIAQALGSPRDYRFARTLIEGAVLTAPLEGRIVYNSWRRFIFSELLRRGALVAGRGSGVPVRETSSAPLASPRTIGSFWRRRSVTSGTRVLAFTCSQHRPIMLRHCIMQMQRQSYLVDHVIYVNSPEEQTGSHTSLNYGTLLEDVCRSTKGLTRIAYGPSRTYHQNYLNAIRLAQIDDYDLFLKVDDDDIYLTDYVLGVVRDFEQYRWDYSGGSSHGHLNGYRWEPDVILRGLGLGEGEANMGIPNIMPPTIALSQKAIRELLAIKDNGDFDDIQWRRHLAQVPGIEMRTRDEQNFIYNIHGGNASTGSWHKV